MSAKKQVGRESCILWRLLVIIVGLHKRTNALVSGMCFMRIRVDESRYKYGTHRRRYVIGIRAFACSGRVYCFGATINDETVSRM